MITALALQEHLLTGVITALALQEHLLTGVDNMGRLGGCCPFWLCLGASQCQMSLTYISSVFQIFIEVHGFATLNQLLGIITVQSALLHFVSRYTYAC